MKQKTRHKTTVTDEIIQEVHDLAEQGFNNILIGQSLNIATQTLSTNKVFSLKNFSLNQH